MYDVIIVGAGPSGLMCASNLVNKKVLLIDKNSQIGGKLKVSGGGRCNVTTTKDIDNLLACCMPNPKFLYPTLNNFSPKDFYNYLSKTIELKEEDNNRVFPKNNKSQTIIDFFNDKLYNVDVLLNTSVFNIDYYDNIYTINEKYKTKNLVIATGGMTHQQLGTTGDGYEFAKQFNHKITTLFPTESPLVSNDEIITSKVLQGITLENVIINVYINNKKKLTLQNNLLFTHFGLSGPSALHSSTLIKKALLNKKRVKIEVDLNSCVLPKRFKVQNFEELIINIVDVKGYNTAFLTGGGISLKEIDPKTYMSKLNDKLFFIGEVLDINCYTGGNNITVFASQGKTCADFINQNLD